jgi:glutaredoxin 3
MAEQLLAEEGFAIDEKISLLAEPHRRQEMIERTGRETVPQIFIDGIHVGGYDDLKALRDEGRLKEILGRA